MREMKRKYIENFAKENKYMTQIDKDVDMDAALSALSTLSANVEAISESDELKELVHSIPVGYSVYNPVVKFTKRAKNGRYDNLSDEEYCAKLDDVNIIGSLLHEKHGDDFINVDMRDAYARMLEAAVQVQTCLKQMHDIAMFLKVSDAVNVFEDEDKN
ncbi:hypothetical protein FYJ25_00210 [Anaerobutyricum soehngenii]|uniref:Uncharacterized protein n=1 Tax=Anaerobutyricum soehngenii TaxID=105843 RepID=A0A6N7Y8R2_9FIRM|nr:hypothetical protein [Anaerobutyricum soehngenii]MSU80823.1 hypothetical protein [Anaerobutyricum soehngenii]